MKVDAVSLGAARLVHGSHDLIALARTVLDRAINLLEVPSLMLNALGTIRAPARTATGLSGTLQDKCE